MMYYPILATYYVIQKNLIQTKPGHPVHNKKFVCQTTKVLWEYL